MKNNRSAAQRQRQDSEHRSRGKYAKTNPCYACDKSAGIDYSSHPLTDVGGWGDIALCLCKKCYDLTLNMIVPSEFIEFKNKLSKKNTR